MRLSSSTKVQCKPLITSIDRFGELLFVSGTIVTFSYLWDGRDIERIIAALLTALRS